MSANAYRLRAIVLVGLLSGCTHPKTKPHETVAPRLGSWSLASATEVCASLIAHVKTDLHESRALTCSEEPLAGTASEVLPMSIVHINGASRPLAYFAYAPPEGNRRVLAEYRGRPGMRFTAAVTSTQELRPGTSSLVQVTTAWTGADRSTKSLTLCLADPPHNDMNFPVCAFTTLIERSSGTANVSAEPQEPQQAWSVAIDRKFGVALVIQVRGERDPSVPTGAFRIHPPWW